MNTRHAIHDHIVRTMQTVNQTAAQPLPFRSVVVGCYRALLDVAARF